MQCNVKNYWLPQHERTWCRWGSQCAIQPSAQQHHAQELFQSGLTHWLSHSAFQSLPFFLLNFCRSFHGMLDAIQRTEANTPLVPLFGGVNQGLPPFSSWQRQVGNYWFDQQQPVSKNQRPLLRLPSSKEWKIRWARADRFHTSYNSCFFFSFIHSFLHFFHKFHHQGHELHGFFSEAWITTAFGSLSRGVCGLLGGLSLSWVLRWRSDASLAVSASPGFCGGGLAASLVVSALPGFCGGGVAASLSGSISLLMGSGVGTLAHPLDEVFLKRPKGLSTFDSLPSSFLTFF